MNDKQCHHIESPAICPTLQESGLPSIMQRGTFVGTLASLVLNNRKISGTQGLKHIINLINFVITDSITGKQLKA